MDWAFAFILFFGLLGIALPGYRNFLPLSPLNLILTLVIFYKVNKDFSPRF
jgi:putative membrane protein